MSVYSQFDAKLTPYTLLKRCFILTSDLLNFAYRNSRRGVRFCSSKKHRVVCVFKGIKHCDKRSNPSVLAKQVPDPNKTSQRLSIKMINVADKSVLSGSFVFASILIKSFLGLISTHELI